MCGGLKGVCESRDHCCHIKRQSGMPHKHIHAGGCPQQHQICVDLHFFGQPQQCQLPYSTAQLIGGLALTRGTKATEKKRIPAETMLSANWAQNDRKLRVLVVSAQQGELYMQSTPTETITRG
jgi:hypothetical protein